MTFNLQQENNRRKKLRTLPYDPLTGEGCCGTRTDVWLPGNRSRVSVPSAMTADPRYHRTLTRRDFDRLRMEYDFEFWCATCVTIKDKSSHRNVRMRLNRPQRIVLAALEGMRTAGRPIRAILLKARQCGGSTLIQVYMAWIQLLHRNNWHSLICAHVKDAAMTIRGMMTKLLANYPGEYLPDGVKEWKMRSFEGSRSTSLIGNRENTVTITSAETPEAARGKDLAMAHLSEAAFWRTSPGHDPNDIIRSISGSIALQPETLLVIESTANGVGNYFHDEWLRAESGLSDKCPIFTAWHDNDIYTLDVPDADAFFREMDDYERGLWEQGLTLEQIHWYHCKRKEYISHRAMQAEYPTTAQEAFAATDRCVFDEAAVERLRTDCLTPPFTGDIHGLSPKGRDALRQLRLTPQPGGRLSVWRHPERSDQRESRYLTVVDIGGRSDASDFSVIAVIDRYSDRGKPEVAAQWRGHTDHDLLAWKAAQIAAFYNRGLLVIESNTIETEQTEGDNSGFVLDEIADSYPNLYYRRSIDRATGTASLRIGFHTNRSTKPLIVNRHIATVRDGGYIEHDNEAVNEHRTYERLPNGSFAAKERYHDDILMTRCIGLFIDDELKRNSGTNISALKRPSNAFSRDRQTAMFQPNNQSKSRI